MAAEKKDIVIIGLGLGSTVLAHNLEKTLPATHRLVVITESDAGQCLAGFRPVCVVCSRR